MVLGFIAEAVTHPVLNARYFLGGSRFALTTGVQTVKHAIGAEVISAIKACAGAALCRVDVQAAAGGTDWEAAEAEGAQSQSDILPRHSAQRKTIASRCYCDIRPPLQSCRRLQDIEIKQ